MSYYNTNKEEGDQLLQSENNAHTQEQQIIKLFSNGEYLSPDEILDICNQEHNYPITSIRRALTNLTNKGLLVKTDTFKLGKFGKKTHTWSLSMSKCSDNFWGL
jgi:Fe2+ or Zn2+ uptake regulation protein